jgi:Tfp pilus assembly protein PilX
MSQENVIVNSGLDWGGRLLRANVKAMKIQRLFRGVSRRSSEQGSALLVALFMMVILTLIGLGFVLTALTDATITHTNRQALAAYFVSEAGNEEAINKVVTAPMSTFNPATYTGSAPGNVTNAFYSNNTPIAVGAGQYTVDVQYLGKTVLASDSVLNATLSRYLVSTVGRSSVTNIGSKQTVASQVYSLSAQYSFPQHPIISCNEPQGSGPWRINGLDASGVIDPSAPANWPGTGSGRNPGGPNYGTTPWQPPDMPHACAGPDEAIMQTVFQTAADYVYSSSITDGSPLPSQFWKVPPSSSPSTPGQPYTVFVNGDLTVNGSSNIYGVYYVMGNVTFNSSASLLGVIFAPHGTFIGHGSGNSNPQIQGSLIANDISTSGNHYAVQFNPSYVPTTLILGAPYRLSRAGR